MTIKELERRTGLPRTSIRFYEQEGLLTPERRENNYRDYSEDNVRTLEKIKLLRRLSQMCIRDSPGIAHRLDGCGEPAHLAGG